MNTEITQSFNIDDIGFDEFAINSTHFLKQLIKETLITNSIFNDLLTEIDVLKISVIISALSSQGMPSKEAYKLALTSYLQNFL